MDKISRRQLFYWPRNNFVSREISLMVQKCPLRWRELHHTRNNSLRRKIILSGKKDSKVSRNKTFSSVEQCFYKLRIFRWSRIVLVDQDFFVDRELFCIKNLDARIMVSGRLTPKYDHVVEPKTADRISRPEFLDQLKWCKISLD